MNAHFPDHQPNFSYGSDDQPSFPYGQGAGTEAALSRPDRTPLPSSSELGNVALRTGLQTGNKLLDLSKRGLALIATAIVAAGGGALTVNALDDKPSVSQPFEFDRDDTVDAEAIAPNVSIATPHAELLRLRERYPGIEIDAGAEFVQENISLALREYLKTLERTSAFPLELGPSQPFDLSSESQKRGLTPDQLLAGIDPVLFIGEGRLGDTANQLANRKSLLEFMALNTELFTPTHIPDFNIARNISLQFTNTDFRAYDDMIALIKTLETSLVLPRDFKVSTTVAVAKDEALVDSGHLGDFKITSPTHVITAGGGSGWEYDTINWAFQMEDGYATEADGITKKNSVPRIVYGVSSTELGFIRDLNTWNPHSK